MSKSLTEQWKDGELSNDSYYVKDWDGTINRFVAQNNILWRDSNNPIYASERIEVLEPVPSYEEYQKLKEQLEEANEVIKYFTYGKYTIIKSRKKGLAKEFEKDVSNVNWKGIKYLDKWGVK